MIENMIYEIRGKDVMLDFDLARLYQCKNGTKVINQAVNRNIERFPNDFYFQLTKEEYLDLKSQIVTSNLNNKYGGTRKLPYAFTEQGVAMLASVLRTEMAAKISVDIMRAFASMRKYISNNLLEQRYINNMVFEHDKDIKLLQETFTKLMEKKKENEIFFNGMIYDAYSKILDIFSETKEKLIIIDSYADKVVLDIIRRLKVKVLLITTDRNLSEKDIETYNKQYDNLKVIYDDSFHDRYFIIDNNVIYHCGTSINKIGYKTFCINVIGDEGIKKVLLNRVKKLNNILF